MPSKGLYRTQLGRRIFPRCPFSILTVPCSVKEAESVSPDQGPKTSIPDDLSTCQQFSNITDTLTISKAWNNIPNYIAPDLACTVSEIAISYGAESISRSPVLSSGPSTDATGAPPALSDSGPQRHHSKQRIRPPPSRHLVSDKWLASKLLSLPHPKALQLLVLHHVYGEEQPKLISCRLGNESSTTPRQRIHG